MRRLTEGQTQTVVADNVGVSQAAIGRWRGGQVPDAPQIVALVRAYEGNVVEAFIAAGFFTADEAALPISEPFDLEAVSGVELSREVTRRLTDADAAVVTGRQVQPAGAVREAETPRPRRSRRAGETR